GHSDTQACEGPGSTSQLTLAATTTTIDLVQVGRLVVRLLVFQEASNLAFGGFLNFFVHEPRDLCAKPLFLLRCQTHVSYSIVPISLEGGMPGYPDPCSWLHHVGPDRRSGIFSSTAACEFWQR